MATAKPTTKKAAPSKEQTEAEAATFEPVVSTPKGKKEGTTKKAFVDDKMVDVVENSRYPRHAQSENYQVEVVSPMTSIPVVRIAPKNWVGPVPLTVPETRLDELIELLTKVR